MTAKAETRSGLKHIAEAQHPNAVPQLYQPSAQSDIRDASSLIGIEKEWHCRRHRRTFRAHCGLVSLPSSKPQCTSSLTRLNKKKHVPTAMNQVAQLLDVCFAIACRIKLDPPSRAVPRSSISIQAMISTALPQAHTHECCMGSSNAAVTAHCRCSE